MSTIGKRVIFVGPAGAGNNSKPLNVEGKALAAIAAGTVVEKTATGIQALATAATVFGKELLVADKDQMRTRSVDDPWTINENMVAIKPRSGEFVNVLVAAGNDITSAGMALSSNGDGTLKIAATDGTEEILAHSEEVINVTGSAALVCVSPA